MDLLREEWLAPTMICEIRAMIHARAGASHKPNAIDSRDYLDDGSNLRVKSSIPGIVQITKVRVFLTTRIILFLMRILIQLYTFDGAIKVAVSDSYTFMRATIASSAAARNTASTRKRITKDTLGGLIQIKEFEIVATHLGARSERATILVQDFRSLGSEGSGGFGCPRPLESLPEIVDLMDQLKALRAEESTRSRSRSSLGSPAEQSPSRSQLANGDVAHTFQETSQSVFATQIPSRFSSIPLVAEREAQRGSDVNRAELQQQQGCLVVDAKSKAFGKKNVNNTKALLDLLAPKRVATHLESSHATTKKWNPAQLSNPPEDPAKKPFPSKEAYDKASSLLSPGPAVEVHEQDEGIAKESLTTLKTSELAISQTISKEESVSFHGDQFANENSDVAQASTALNSAVVTHILKVFEQRIWFSHC